MFYVKASVVNRESIDFKPKPDDEEGKGKGQGKDKGDRQAYLLQQRAKEEREKREKQIRDALKKSGNSK